MPNYVLIVTSIGPNSLHDGAGHATESGTRTPFDCGDTSVSFHTRRPEVRPRRHISGLLLGRGRSVQSRTATCHGGGRTRRHEQRHEVTVPTHFLTTGQRIRTGRKSRRRLSGRSGRGRTSPTTGIHARHHTRPGRPHCDAPASGRPEATLSRGQPKPAHQRLRFPPTSLVPPHILGEGDAPEMQEVCPHVCW